MRDDEEIIIECIAYFGAKDCEHFYCFTRECCFNNDQRAVSIDDIFKRLQRN